jgi:elongation factor P--beta-lysine ligase
MEYLFIALLFYVIGEYFGKKKGKKHQYEFRYLEGYRKGINQVESEIEELSKLPDKEILKRIKNFKSKKGDK